MHKLHTCTTPSTIPPPACLPTHWQCLATCSGLSSLSTLPPTSLSPSPSLTSANVSSFAWRPWATPSTFSAVSLPLPLPSFYPLPPSFSLPSFSLLHLSGCTFRFNFVAIMHAKVQCFVGILFTQPPLHLPLPPPLLVGILLRVSYSSVSSLSLSHSLSHSATVKMKCAKCTLSTAFINILVLVGRA